MQKWNVKPVNLSHQGSFGCRSRSNVALFRRICLRYLSLVSDDLCLSPPVQCRRYSYFSLNSTSGKRVFLVTARQNYALIFRVSIARARLSDVHFCAECDYGVLRAEGLLLAIVLVGLVCSQHIRSYCIVLNLACIGKKCALLSCCSCVGIVGARSTSSKARLQQARQAKEGERFKVSLAFPTLMSI